MAAITLTADRIALVDPMQARVKSYIANAAIAAGQAVYLLTTGKVGVADANAAGMQQFRGIALNAGAAGQAIDVLEDGELWGFDVSGMNCDAFAYLSDTAGGLDTAAGTMTVVCGRVVPMADKGLTKVLHITVRRDAVWA